VSLPRRALDDVQVGRRIGDHLLDALLVQADLRCEPTETVRIADVRGFRPVCVHQAVMELLVEPALTCEL
jgi:hypothetical protein